MSSHNTSDYEIEYPEGSQICDACGREDAEDEITPCICGKEDCISLVHRSPKSCNCVVCCDSCGDAMRTGHGEQYEDKPHCQACVAEMREIATEEALSDEWPRVRVPLVDEVFA